MIGRLLHKADFERMLATPERLRSAHFAVHHLAAAPPLVLSAWQAAQHRCAASGHKPSAYPTEISKLSTDAAPTCPQPVDDLLQDHWIACVVPKRHAKRSVTRSLLKRQVRSVFEAQAAALPAGQWLVRLRSPFAPKVFVSAASEALRKAARDELERLFSRAKV